MIWKFLEALKVRYLTAGLITGISAVNNAGGFNGDGISDLIIGANGNDFNGVSNGTVFVVFGSSDVIFKSSFDD